MKMKLQLVLFLTAVLAASAVHARSSLYEDLLKRLSLQPKRGDVNRGVVATQTNGTLESFSEFEGTILNTRYI